MERTRKQLSLLYHIKREKEQKHVVKLIARYTTVGSPPSPQLPISPVGLLAHGAIRTLHGLVPAVQQLLRSHSQCEPHQDGGILGERQQQPREVGNFKGH